MNVVTDNLRDGYGNTYQQHWALLKRPVLSED